MLCLFGLTFLTFFMASDKLQTIFKSPNLSQPFLQSIYYLEGSVGKLELSGIFGDPIPKILIDLGLPFPPLKSY